jgi:inhibitor of cysteine peptidase
MFSVMANAKEINKAAVDSIYTEDKQNIIVSPKHPEFTLKLKSNPTTGFAWFLRGYDANVITPVKHHLEKATDEKLMGSPGYELWTFKVKPAGFIVPQQTTLRMIYGRAWQGNDGSTQLVFRITTQSK